MAVEYWHSWSKRQWLRSIGSGQWWIYGLGFTTSHLEPPLFGPSLGRKTNQVTFCFDFRDVQGICRVKPCATLCGIHILEQIITAVDAGRHSVWSEWCPERGSSISKKRNIKYTWEDCEWLSEILKSWIKLEHAHVTHVTSASSAIMRKLLRDKNAAAICLR